ncbi:hypothetical protein ABRG53_3906 [Pseudanabaena sp. ABRG5-3]|nr:hypothetical protein ABRG53_3906 [Pseudanabaena sp. ABRG5-3]
MIGRQEKKMVIAPNIADMGNASSMPMMKNAKYFSKKIVNSNMTLLAAARTK